MAAGLGPQHGSFLVSDDSQFYPGKQRVCGSLLRLSTAWHNVGAVTGGPGGTGMSNESARHMPVRHVLQTSGFLRSSRRGARRWISSQSDNRLSRSEEHTSELQ